MISKKYQKIKRGVTNMLYGLVLLWILITLNAPIWAYLLLGIKAIVWLLAVGIQAGKVSKEDE